MAKYTIFYNLFYAMINCSMYFFIYLRFKANIEALALSIFDFGEDDCLIKWMNFNSKEVKSD